MIPEGFEIHETLNCFYSGRLHNEAVAVVRISRRPLGTSPRLLECSRRPDASACRLICATFWAR